MVALVLRLRADLLLSAVRGDRSRVQRFVTALVIAVAATVAAVIAVQRLSSLPLPVAATVAVWGGAVIALGFGVGPMLVGASDPLDPRRFVGFPVNPRSLPWILLLAGFVSVPSLALCAVFVALGAVAVGFGASVGVVFVAGITVTVSCLLAARIGMLIVAGLTPERRPRELTGLFTILIVAVAVPAVLFLGSLVWGDGVPAQLQNGATVLGRTPWGAAFAWMFGSSALDTSAVWLNALIAVGTMVVLAGVWAWLVRREFTEGPWRQSAPDAGGLGWFALLPANAFGAVAARSLIYWMRDRRYMTNIVIVPIAAVLAVVPLRVAGVPADYAAAVPVLLMALFLGWMPHNDAAYDSTALWTHVAAAVRGVADRAGRLVPIVVVSLPLLAIGIAASLAAIGRWSLLPAFVGACAALYFAGLGLSSVTSAVAPYPVARPGDSPFRQPQRGSTAGGFGQALTLLGTLLLGMPAILLLWNCIGDADASVLPPLWWGLATGIVVLFTGVLCGGVLFERRSKQLMEFIEST